MRKKTRADSTSLLNGHANDVGWRKELHHAVLNFLSLKSRMTSVHRSQKPRTSDAMSTRRPCFSPLNLPGILHLFASHLRITNYQRTCRTLLISVVSVPFFSTSSFFSLSSSVSSSYKQPRTNVTDVPRPKVSKYSPSSHKEPMFRSSSFVFIACWSYAGNSRHIHFKIYSLSLLIAIL